jgi:hypothetical protein
VEVPRSRLDLQDDRELLSPPFVVEPLYRCATAVVVRGFIAAAELDLEIDGAIVDTRAAGFPEPNGEIFQLAAPLAAGQVVRARQRFGGAQSAWSAPATSRDHTVDYPAGLPRPRVNPAPVHECGSRTGVENLVTGCNVWIEATGTEVGRVNGAAPHQGVNVNPDYGLAQDVVAFAELCGEASPPSETHVTQPPPSPMPAPGFEPVYEGGQQLTVTGLANGARFDLGRNGTPLGTWRTWGQRHLVGLNPPFSAGEAITVSQRLCPGNPPSVVVTTTVEPCSKLPAPGVMPIQAGDTRVTLTSFVPDARIQVYLNLVKVGDGGGPIVVLTQGVSHGDTVHVLQRLGACVGNTVQEVRVSCVAPALVSDPAALDLFPVGTLTYNGGTFTFLGESLPIRGTVYYPAEADGAAQPFHVRLAERGPVPIVFIAHGNHGTHRDPVNPVNPATGEENQNCGPVPGWVEIPNHEGYDYLQRQLARMGIIAVGVYSNPGNCRDRSVTTIRRRAELVIASVNHLRSLHGGTDPIFGGRIDFSRVGLLGHSQGGEAVIVVPEVPLAGVTILGVLSLAPVDFQASSGVPRGYAFMTILPAGDGDVRRNDGAKFYDRADPGPFKCQLYVHHANHNFFNRQWLENDGAGTGPLIMSRADHERVLSTYGCAFFRAVLLGHATTDILARRTLPVGTPTGSVYHSFEWTDQETVDDHEDGNTINFNSLGQMTAQVGLSADEHPFVRLAAGRFNDTFFGATIGMVAVPREVNGHFRTPLPAPVDLSRREVWVRCAEVYNGTNLPAGATGFQLGLEDDGGNQVWIDSNDVGGLARPYERTDALTKTMLQTLRFPAGCGRTRQSRFDPGAVRAVLLWLNRGDDRPLAFDVVQLVDR